MFLEEKSEAVDFRAEHAAPADVCEVFERELKPLYLLAFLLTANHKEAEEGLVKTADEALKAQGAIKEWAQSWIRRSLIKNAIGIVSPVSGRCNEKRNLWSVGICKNSGDDEINAVTQLPPLARFVFVMSFLERYSVWDCSLLLGCSAQKVAQCRTEALLRLPRPVEIFPRVEPRASRLAEIVA